MPLQLVTSWVSVFFDENRGGYHARWRNHVEDTKRKIPHAFFQSRGVDSSAPSERGAKLAYQWAVHNSPLGKKEENTESSTLGLIWRIFAEKNPNNIEPQTMKKYSERVRPLIEFFDEGRGVAPGEIDRSEAAEFVRWRMERPDGAKGPSSLTVRTELGLLKQLLECGVEWREATGMTGIRLFRLPRVRATEAHRVALTPDQIRAVVAANPANISRELVARAKRIFVVGLTTMLRDTPLRELRWEWIDHKRKWLSVPAEAMKMRKPLSVPLCQWAIEAIGEEGPGDYVFPNPVNGGATKGMYGTFAVLAKAAGTPRFRPHDLRRSGYTYLAEHGVERIVRKVLMGHQAGIDASDLYDRSFVERMRQAVGYFDELREH